MNQLQNKFENKKNNETAFVGNELIHNNNEAKQEQRKGLGTFLDKINNAYSFAIGKFNLNGKEATAKADEILLDNAKNSHNIDDANAVLVEGALEFLNKIDSNSENPTITLDNYDNKLVNQSVIDLYENQIELESGESIASIAIEQIDIKDELLDRFEKLDKNNYCKTTAGLSQQIHDERNCMITFISNQRGLYDRTSRSSFDKERQTLTENECLVELTGFLTNISNLSDIDEKYKDKAKNMLESLTWIGEKEYQEAATSIAEYWKHKLKNNPKLHIFPVAGQIDKETKCKDGPGSDVVSVKSDDWLLENILLNFTDDEIIQFKDRLIFNEANIPTDLTAKNLDIILLDDWTISGSQLLKVYRSMSERIPKYKNSFQVQLIAANENRIEGGFKRFDHTGRHEIVPLKAYYKAHSTEVLHPLITGYHSSVDYDFEEEISGMLKQIINSNSNPNKDIRMPAGTNIVRPYRNNNFKLERTAQVQDLIKNQTAQISNPLYNIERE